MSQYMVQWDNGSGFTSMALTPGSLSIKINRVEFVIGTPSQLIIYKKTSGSITGGTTLTPTSFRVGAPTAGVTAKFNYSSVSGTQANYVANNSSATSPWQPAASLMIAPGSVFAVANTVGAGFQYIAIYFDEQRLQGGF